MNSSRQPEHLRCQLHAALNEYLNLACLSPSCVQKGLLCRYCCDSPEHKGHYIMTITKLTEQVRQCSSGKLGKNLFEMSAHRITDSRARVAAYFNDARKAGKNPPVEIEQGLIQRFMGAEQRISKQLNLMSQYTARPFEVNFNQPVQEVQKRVIQLASDLANSTKAEKQAIYSVQATCEAVEKRVYLARELLYQKVLGNLSPLTSPLEAGDPVELNPPNQPLQSVMMSNSQQPKVAPTKPILTLAEVVKLGPETKSVSYSGNISKEWKHIGAHLASLPYLETLKTVDCDLTVDFFEELCDSKSLKVLYLGNLLLYEVDCPVSDDCLDEIICIGSLTNLHIENKSGSRLTNKSFDKLLSASTGGSLKELKYLNVKFPGIMHIDLVGRAISDRDAEIAFSCLPNLKSMNISNNGIGPLGAASIAKHLKGLTNLDISDNSLGDDGAMILGKGLTNLKSLTMPENNISKECAAWFVKNMKGTEVVCRSD